jgi:hypothetical protein
MRASQSSGEGSSPGEEVLDGPLSYREAVEALGARGYATVRKSLYTESVQEHLERIASQPPGAEDQLVRARLAEEGVELYRVQRVGDEEYVDESPIATLIGAGPPE